MLTEIKFVFIPIEKLNFAEENPRQDLSKESLQELKESLSVEGMIQPILVRPYGNEYQVVAGERRVRAALLNGWTKIPAIIRDISDKEAVRLMIIENINRLDFDVFEKAEAVKVLIEKHGKTYNDIAREIHKTVETVKNWVKVAQNISPKVRLKYARKLKPEWYMELIEWDDETQDKLANAITMVGLSNLHQIRWFIKLFKANPHGDPIELAKRTKQELEYAPVLVPKKEAKRIREAVKAKRKRLERKAEEFDKELQSIRREPAPLPTPEVTTTEHPEELIRAKAETLADKLTELEPSQQGQVADTIGRRLDTLTKSVDKETLGWMEKWETEISPRVKEETPEHYAMKLEELIHGIWIRIGVEYPEKVKEFGQKKIVKDISSERLERIQKTIGITIGELEEFQGVIESELFLRRTRTN